MDFIPGLESGFNTQKPINLVHLTNRLDDRKKMNISIDAEKWSDKIQHSFKIKTQQMGKKG